MRRAAALLKGLAALATVRTPLRDLPPLEPLGDAGWTSIAKGGTTREARRVTAALPLTWRAYALPGSRVDVWCAADAASPARLTIVADTGDAHTQANLTAQNDAWKRLSLRLPRDYRGEVRLSLTVEDTSGGSIWIADPVLSYARPLTAMLRTAVAAFRVLGPGAVFRRTAGAADEAEEVRRYRAWRAARDARAAAAAPPTTRGPLVSVITPVFDTDPAWLRACIASVQAQSYQDWELILSDDGSRSEGTRRVLAEAARAPRIRVTRAEHNGGIARASNAALALAAGEFVALLDHDDRLDPHALARVVDRFSAAPPPDVVYTDEDTIDPSGVPLLPHFKPDWSPERLLSCMYAAHLLVFRRSLLTSLGGFRSDYDGAQDYDLLLRAAESTDRIAHVPDVLYSWRTTPRSAAGGEIAKPWAVDAGRRALEAALTRRGIGASVSNAAAAGHYRIRYRLEPSATVAVMLIGGTRAAESVRASATRIAEVIDARSGADGARLNTLVRGTAAPFVLLLDADLTPLDRDWLDTLIGLAQQHGVGAAGATLLTEAGTIDHAGIVLGAEGGATCAFRGAPAWTRGHRANALDVRNCSAVSARCLLTPRAAFERAGGFDAALASPLLEIDYGLRLEASGLRVAISPDARLRGPARCADLSDADLSALRPRWGDRLDRDPYQIGGFTVHGSRFTVRHSTFDIR